MLFFLQIEKETLSFTTSIGQRMSSSSANITQTNVNGATAQSASSTSSDSNNNNNNNKVFTYKRMRMINVCNFVRQYNIHSYLFFL
jgi:hypothetical protein